MNANEVCYMIMRAFSFSGTEGSVTKAINAQFNRNNSWYTIVYTTEPNLELPDVEMHVDICIPRIRSDYILTVFTSNNNWFYSWTEESLPSFIRKALKQDVFMDGTLHTYSKFQESFDVGVSIPQSDFLLRFPLLYNVGQSLERAWRESL